VIVAPDWLMLFLFIALWVCLIYTALVYAYVLVMLIFGAFESLLRKRQREVGDDFSLLSSRFTIPVSIVAPVLNEETVIVPALRSLLSQSYPQFEVILVDDGSTDGTMALLKREFDLVRREIFCRRIFPSAAVRGTYRSRKDTRLIVISKENGGTKADPLNCGINFARYRYLCVVDGDTIFEPDALLRTMSHVVKDPAVIVGATSLFGSSHEPEKVGAGAGEYRRLDRHLYSRFQHLDLMRSFIATRLAWSRLDAMMCTSGAFSIWRRDVIIEMGGFSKDFTCEDIEMTFRVHERFLREKRPYRILSLPFMVAQTESPGTISRLVRQRARWQRVILETVWHFRRMMLRPKYRTVGLVGFPYYVFFEVLAPLFQVLALVAFALAVAFGVLGWPIYLLLLGTLVFLTAMPVTVTILLHDQSYRDYRVRDLLRMLLLAPAELFLYRPILMYAGFKGTLDFLMGAKGWDKFERNVRSATPHSGKT
jgi:biofilm PGA synthesis N-glycosyltransferase PgaC